MKPASSTDPRPQSLLGSDKQPYMADQARVGMMRHDLFPDLSCVCVGDLRFSYVQGSIIVQEVGSGHALGSYRLPAASAQHAKLLATDGRLFVASSEGDLHCLSADAALQTHWSIKVNPSAVAIDIVAGNGLLFAGFQGRVASLDSKSGAILQARTLQWDLNGEVRLAMQQPYLYAGIYGNVFFLDVTTLAARGVEKIALPGKLASVNLLVADDNLYVGTHGSIYGWSADGTQVLGSDKLNCDGNCEVRLAAADTYLYAEYDGRIAAYALKSLEKNPDWHLFQQG